MKSLAALLFVLLTLDQAMTICTHEVQRVNPKFDILVDDTKDPPQLVWWANARLLFLFRECMREHGHDMEHEV